MQNISIPMEGLWIETNILKDENLSLQEKVVLAVIKALDKSNGCFASNKYFANILQVTPKRASDIIQSLHSKKYITSVIEDHYKRTLRIARSEDTQVVECDLENKEGVAVQDKEKSIMWQGFDLSTWSEDALARIKIRFPQVEALLNGKSIDENEIIAYRTNEELGSVYKEVVRE